MYHLVVRNPFAGYAKGTCISDPSSVAAILSDPHKAASVVKIIAPVVPRAMPAPIVPVSIPTVTHVAEGDGVAVMKAELLKP